jgi:hypothetical protein
VKPHAYDIILYSMDDDGGGGGGGAQGDGLRGWMGGGRGGF